LLLIRFDRGEDLRDRLEESLTLLQATLAALGKVEPVMASYDGSVVSYLLEARQSIQPEHVLQQLQSPGPRRTAALKTHDKVLVVALECGLAARMERVTDWLSEHEILV
jgi:hypothetical protein